MQLAGATGINDIRLSGSAEIMAFNLETQETNLNISGSGKANLNVMQNLNINISGTGEVSYRGQPKVSQRITGSGRVNQIKSSQQQE